MSVFYIGIRLIKLFFNGKTVLFYKIDAKNATRVPKEYTYTIIYCHNAGVKHVKNNKYILCTLYRRFT